LRTPPREFPYVIGFNQGGIRNGSIYPGDIVTEAPNPLGLVPQGTVFKVIVVEGSWTDGDAKGYLWMVPVTDDFWDQRHSTTAVPALFVNNVRKATCSYVGQTLPVILEAPDDPDVEQTTHDRRHVFDPSTIISGGGTVQIEARVNDPFSPQDRAFGLVAWPEEEEVFLDCPPCVGSGLKLDEWGGSWMEDGDFFVGCTYSGSSHDYLAHERADFGSIHITTRDAKRLFSENYSVLLEIFPESIKTDIKGEELSCVHEQMEYTKEDKKKPDPVPSVPHVCVFSVFLYRERYYIAVDVDVFDSPKDAVINTFDELVKCAKAVVDEREGVD
jgi:hypothetical protein